MLDLHMLVYLHRVRVGVCGGRRLFVNIGSVSKLTVAVFP